MDKNRVIAFLNSESFNAAKGSVVAALVGVGLYRALKGRSPFAPAIVALGSSAAGTAAANLCLVNPIVGLPIVVDKARARL